MKVIRTPIVQEDGFELGGPIDVKLRPEEFLKIGTLSEEVVQLFAEKLNRPDLFLGKLSVEELYGQTDTIDLVCLDDLETAERYYRALENNEFEFINKEFVKAIKVSEVVEVSS